MAGAASCPQTERRLLVSRENVVMKSSWLSGPPVASVKLSDLLALSPAPVYIIKTDLQGYDCRALADINLYTSRVFIPYIHMEFNMLGHSNREQCDKTVDILTEHNYLPHIQITVSS